MKEIFVEPSPGVKMHKNIDGIEYEFCIEAYENVDGYAPIMIIDRNADERYHSFGYLELNGHTFTSKWKREYDYNRDNWICSKDLIIEIN